LSTGGGSCPPLTHALTAQLALERAELSGGVATLPHARRALRALERAARGPAKLSDAARALHRALASGGAGVHANRAGVVLRRALHGGGERGSDDNDAAASLLLLLGKEVDAAGGGLPAAWTALDAALRAAATTNDLLADLVRALPRRDAPPPLPDALIAAMLTARCLGDAAPSWREWRSEVHAVLLGLPPSRRGPLLVTVARAVRRGPPRINRAGPEAFAVLLALAAAADGASSSSVVEALLAEALPEEEGDARGTGMADSASAAFLVALARENSGAEDEQVLAVAARRAAQHARGGGSGGASLFSRALVRMLPEVEDERAREVLVRAAVEADGVLLVSSADVVAGAPGSGGGGASMGGRTKA
jgi:hypothetical protein